MTTLEICSSDAASAFNIYEYESKRSATAANIYDKEKDLF